MRTSHLAPLLVAASLLAPLGGPLGCTTVTEVRAAPPPPAPPPGPLLDPFYEPLSPYGEWFWNDHWGWVYSPHVGPAWRPYTMGSWVWTDEGWLWMSNEPFGWACFHYGRWLWLDDAGWIWIPGRVWGPSWVVWRTGPGYIGWGPLPPPGYASVELAYGPWGWVLVPGPSFLVHDVSLVVVHPAHNAHVLPETRVIHRPEAGDRDDDRSAPHALDKDTIEHITKVQVRPRSIVEVQPGDDERRPPPDDHSVVIRRARALEVKQPSDDKELDLPGRRGVLTPGSDVEERPLKAPSDDEVDRDWSIQRKRLEQIQDEERKAPRPPAQPADELRRRQEKELQDSDEQKEREKKALAKKRVVPRKVPKAKPRHQP